jgi:hypothetical protein
MRILLNPFKSHLCVLSFIAFLLLFTPVLTANEPAIKPTNQEFITKTAKLHMPFISNNGQMDGQVIFYAKTFGGTVFVTKEGKATLVFSKRKNPHFKIDIDYDNDGKYDNYKLPDRLEIE